MANEDKKDFNAMLHDSKDIQAVSVRQIIVWLEAGCLLSITPRLCLCANIPRHP